MRKRFLFLCALYCFLCAPLFAQHCSILLCNKVTKENGRTNFVGIFSDFNEKAVGASSSFTTTTTFQGYSLGVPHRYNAVITYLEDGSIMDSTNTDTFQLDEPYESFRSTVAWRVIFRKAGIYTISMVVDGKVAQQLFVQVGSAPNVVPKGLPTCSTFMCDEQLNGEYGNTYAKYVTGFTAAAVGSKNKYSICSRIQNGEAGKFYTYHLKIVQLSTGRIVDDTPKKTFTLKYNTVGLEEYIWNLDTNFPEIGNYALQVYVNDQLAQKLVFRVGN